MAMTVSHDAAFALTVSADHLIGRISLGVCANSSQFFIPALLSGLAIRIPWLKTKDVSTFIELSIRVTQQSRCVPMHEYAPSQAGMASTKFVLHLILLLTLTKCCGHALVFDCIVLNRLSPSVHSNIMGNPCTQWRSRTGAIPLVSHHNHP